MKYSNKEAIGKRSSTFSIMLISLVEKVLAFLRTTICAAIFGATAATDAFYMALNIILLISGYANGLSIVIVPKRMELLQSGRKSADSLTNKTLNLSIILAICLVGIGIVFSDSLALLFAPNFNPKIIALTSEYLVILLPVIFFVTVYSVFIGILNTHGRHSIASLAGIPLNLFWMIVSVLFYKTLGVQAMLYGYLVGSVIQMIVFIPFLKGVYKYQFQIAADKDVKETLRLSIPYFIGNYMIIINQAVDKMIASGLEAGSVSAMNYSTQLTNLVYGIIIASILTTLYTSLAKAYYEKKADDVKDILNHAFTLLILILLPVTIISLFESKDIVQIVYMRGQFDQSAAALTNSSFFYYAIGFIPMGLGMALTRVFNVIKKTKYVLIINVISVGINALLSWILSKRMAVGGIALATSIANILSCIMLYCTCKKMVAVSITLPVENVIKIVAASFLVVLISFLFGSIALPPVLRFGLITVCSFFVYIVSLLVLKEESVTVFYKKLRGKML